MKCIRCGACLNVCPVYRQASGHAYRHVYPGPVGAVLAPALEGVEDYGDLPKASTLCGSCEEVCPVIIPIPDMLVRLRSETKSSIDFSGFKLGATNPALWKAGLKLLPMAKAVAPKGWTDSRSVPEQSSVNFRRWWRDRS
ncbi:MAG: 4Fe-4S dicluster domain-containing protein [Verrucomicrobiales bacterium]